MSGNHILENELMVQGKLENTESGEIPSLCQIEAEGWLVTELINSGEMTITAAGTANKVLSSGSSLSFGDEVEITELTVKDSSVTFEERSPNHNCRSGKWIDHSTRYHAIYNVYLGRRCFVRIRVSISYCCPIWWWNRFYNDRSEFQGFEWTVGRFA